MLIVHVIGGRRGPAILKFGGFRADLLSEMVLRPHGAVGTRRTSGHTLALLAAAILLSAKPAQASAWDQEPGHGQIILTTTFLETSRSFDVHGESHLFPDGGSFRQYAVNAYVDIGIHRRFDLVANLPFDFLRYSNTYGSQKSAGAGDIEVGLKYRLNSLESPWAISAQITTKFPAYPQSTNPAPGNHQEDIEARFLIGRGAELVGRHVFWDAEAAYRYRAGAPADQFRGDFTAGMDLTARWMVMAQVFTITSMQNGAPFEITNPNAQSDFDLYKGQGSVVLKITRKLRVQAGWTYAFAGRNAGRDHTVTLGIWKNF